MTRFSLVLGILAIMVVAMYWIANFTGDASPGSYDIGDKTVQPFVDQRLSPVGGLQVAGQSSSQVNVATPSAVPILPPVSSTTASAGSIERRRQ